MNKPINLYTIGFTQKTAQQFFDTLVTAGVTRVIDTRLNNVSQLSGFTKRNDLEYFLEKIGGIKYIHILDMAPSPRSVSNSKHSYKTATQTAKT